jgi:broad specificity phosphatase PhoE
MFVNALIAALLILAGPGGHASLSEAHAAAPPGGASLVLLVRHAEKATEPADDPALTGAGVARAQALATALRDADVTTVITTQLRRTRDTALPLATARGLTPEVVPMATGALPAHVEATVTAIRRHAGGVVLVVGHSNTIPAIIAALGGPRLPDLCDSAYSNLFILQLDGAAPRLVQAHYGVPDPDSGPGCK